MPPNTTSKLQPMDAGIISSLKRHYRKRHLEHVLRVLNQLKSTEMNIKEVQEMQTVSRRSGEELYKIDQLTAMR